MSYTDEEMDHDRRYPPTKAPGPVPKPLCDIIHRTFSETAMQTFAFLMVGKVIANPKNVPLSREYRKKLAQDAGLVCNNVEMATKLTNRLTPVLAWETGDKEKGSSKFRLHDDLAPLVEVKPVFASWSEYLICRAAPKPAEERAAPDKPSSLTELGEEIDRIDAELNDKEAKVKDLQERIDDLWEKRQKALQGLYDAFKRERK